MLSWDTGAGIGTVVDGQPHTNQDTQFAASEGRTYSAGWDDTLRIIDEAARTFAGASLKLSAQPKGVAAAGDRVFVALASETIAIYLKAHPVGEFRTDYTPTAIAAHGSFVAVGADMNQVIVYKVDSANKLSPAATLKSSTAQISALSFSNDGTYLAAGNSSGKICVYKSISSRCELIGACSCRACY